MTNLSIMMPLTFVTGNPNKVIEVHAIIGDTIPIQPLALDIPEIQGSLEEIASDKCRRAAQIVWNPNALYTRILTFQISDQWTGFG